MSVELAQGTLLIVDDEPGGREALEGLLLNQGYHLEFGSSGQEALRITADVLPDLVLLDVMMPGMDGFEVCRRLRLNPVTAQIPVLFITALDDRETRLEGISAGADDFISKPYDRAELRLRVKTIMRIGRYRRLLTERARFNSVVEHAADGYLTVRDDGHITYANAVARRLLDLKDQPGGEDLGEFLDAARRQYRLEPDRPWSDDELRIPGRNHLVRPETRLAAAFWLSVTLLDQPGCSSGERLFRLHDVTEEKDLQRDRHSFHRMVSHKLRTPLNGILSILEILESETAQSEHSEMITLAAESARRLHRGVEEVLDFASLSSRVSRQEIFPLAQGTCLVERLRAEMEIKQFGTRIDPLLADKKIAFSALEVETVCRELFENARKFHPKSSPALTFIAEPGAEGRVRLSVRDDGIHLSPEQFLQVWTPYYQGEKRVTGEVDGMGLGLSVVKSIIVSKGGTVTLRNNPDGPGIEVVIDLPLVSE